jgi:hypothetical protein
MLVPGMTLIAVVIVVHLALITFGSPLMPSMGQGKCISQTKNYEFIHLFIVYWKGYEKQT